MKFRCQTRAITVLLICEKIMCKNHNLVLVNILSMHDIQNLVKFYHSDLKILSGNEILNEILTSIKCHKSNTNAWKMMCNNPNLDLVNINVYTKFGKVYRFLLKILSGNEIMMDRQNDWQNDRQPKCSIAPPPFSRGAIIIDRQSMQLRWSFDIAIFIYKCINFNQIFKMPLLTLT